MKIVVQRVKNARVSVEGSDKIVGEIARGLFVLVGIKKGDTTKEAEVLAEKLTKLRIMADEGGKMNLSVLDVKGEILVVSQFTLIADTTGGNRPSFIDAADPKIAREIYEQLISSLKEKGVKVSSGSFGDYMRIEALLDGPVTIIL